MGWEKVLHKAMEFAQNSKQHQKALYFQSKKDVFLKKSLQLKGNIEEKDRKVACFRKRKTTETD